MGFMVKEDVVSYLVAIEGKVGRLLARLKEIEYNVENHLHALRET